MEFDCGALSPLAAARRASLGLASRVSADAEPHMAIAAVDTSARQHSLEAIDEVASAKRRKLALIAGQSWGSGFRAETRRAEDARGGPEAAYSTG